jgi:hypothetical protein
MAAGTACPSQYSSSTPPPISSSYRQRRTPCWVNSLRPSASVGRTIPHWPLPAVRYLSRDGRLSTYDESVLKLSKVSFRGKCARTGHPVKLPSPTKLTGLGHFPPASQGGRLAGPVFYTISFLWARQRYPTP